MESTLLVVKELVLGWLLVLVVVVVVGWLLLVVVVVVRLLVLDDIAGMLGMIANCTVGLARLFGICFFVGSLLRLHRVELHLYL